MQFSRSVAKLGSACKARQTKHRWPLNRMSERCTYQLSFNVVGQASLSVRRGDVIETASLC
jgi:hypothetical protein